MELLNFDDLIISLGDKIPSYQELLHTTEWNKRRLEILKNDDFYCVECGLSETFSHNNNYYTYNKKYQFLENEIDGVKIKADKVVKSDHKIQLHVHHKYYIKNTLPWNYDDDALVTMCNFCHWKLHKTETIKIYSKRDHQLIELNYTPCIRCNGAGLFPEYSHIQKGVCFRCHGNLFEECIENEQNFWVCKS
jgi:ferredoxin-like protein FixX